MNNSDSFISEVSEEVRRERLYGYLRRYGWIGAVLALLVIGGAGFNEWRQARREAAAQATGAAFRTALLVQDPAERAESLAAFATAHEHAAVPAALARAGALLEANDPAAAAAVLAEIAESAETPPIYRDLAALQRVAILGAELPEGERMATLEALSAPEAPFRALALEQRALAHLEAGDAEAAIADLEAALAHPSAPQGLRARARQLIVAAGGAVPADALPAAVPADG